MGNMMTPFSNRSLTDSALFERNCVGCNFTACIWRKYRLLERNCTFLNAFQIVLDHDLSDGIEFSSQTKWSVVPPEFNLLHFIWKS